MASGPMAPWGWKGLIKQKHPHHSRGPCPLCPRNENGSESICFLGFSPFSPVQDAPPRGRKCLHIPTGRVRVVEIKMEQGRSGRCPHSAPVPPGGGDGALVPDTSKLLLPQVTSDPSPTMGRHCHPHRHRKEVQPCAEDRGPTTGSSDQLQAPGTLLWPECLFPPKIHVLKPNAHCDGVRWGLWEGIRSGVWSPQE